ncbi:MAG: hypothetical protein ABIP79_15395 [Chitinophagaceae bacterium]
MLRQISDALRLKGFACLAMTIYYVTSLRGRGCCYYGNGWLKDRSNLNEKATSPFGDIAGENS